MHPKQEVLQKRRQNRRKQRKDQKIQKKPKNQRWYMDPENGSENAPNYEDVQEIKVMDDQTIAFKLAEPNVAFLEYMTIAILPKHLLEGEDMQESDFFRHPVGTGPYKLESWDAGQSIVMTKNEDYYLGSPKIDKVIFKIVEDDNTQAVQLQSGEIDMALLDPKNAENFKNMDGYSCYDMTTSDYRGIMFNFANDYWKENKDLIPAICYGIDRQAIIDAVLLGQGISENTVLGHHGVGIFWNIQDWEIVQE